MDSLDKRRRSFEEFISKRNYLPMQLSGFSGGLRMSVVSGIYACVGT